MTSIRRLPLWLAGCLIVVGAAFAPTALAQPPYEPNDSLLTAAGPLANNSTYVAADETENDTDYYYFYVTTPSTAQLTFTLTNLGGGFYEPWVWGEVDDSHGGEITSIGEVFAADYATKSVSLEAGKYYVEIHGFSGYGASYQLATSGTEGAFGDYATIQANCAAATAPVNTYQAQLAAALARLKKAEARWRQLRYTHRWRAKRRAKARYLRARETVAAEKRSLKAAEAGQKPWCFIPA